MKRKSSLEIRVSKMESMFDDVSKVMSNLDDALEEYAGIKDKIDELNVYLESGQWQKDFEADEKGLIPKDMKRGVLSEDGLYDLLTEVNRISERARDYFSLG